MTNLSYMSLERAELQHQQLLHDQEKQLANDCDDLLHDFMACEHDDAAVWDKFTQRTHELKEVLRQQQESKKQLQEYRDMQMIEPISDEYASSGGKSGLEGPRM